MHDDAGFWATFGTYIMRALEWLGGVALLALGYLLRRLGRIESKLARHEKEFWPKSEIKEEIAACTNRLRADISHVEASVDKVHTRLDELMKHLMSKHP